MAIKKRIMFFSQKYFTYNMTMTNNDNNDMTFMTMT